MAADPQYLYMTEEEYLTFDRASEIKHEYWDGEVVALSGGKSEHSRLAVKMTVLLELKLGMNNPCRVYNSDMRVQVLKRKYVYPDVTVSCALSDHELGNDIMRSPHLVVEVLSQSTEVTDRGRKLIWYQNHPTIQEYVLINTRVQLVEVYRRGQDGAPWVYTTYREGQTIELQSLDLTVAFDELYANLRIPHLADEEEEE
jgi:Uma2 family endonuclease